MRIVHIGANPADGYANSSDGLLTWGLPNSRWILHQFETKVLVENVITEYSTFSFSFKKNATLIKIFLVLYFHYYVFSIYDRVNGSLSKQLRNGDNFGNTLSELDINNPTPLSSGLFHLSKIQLV